MCIDELKSIFLYISQNRATDIAQYVLHAICNPQGNAFSVDSFCEQ